MLCIEVLLVCITALGVAITVGLILAKEILNG